jgi:trehalose synthase
LGRAVNDVADGFRCFCVRRAAATAAQGAAMSRDGDTTVRLVEAAPRSLDDYRGIAPDDLLDEVSALAAALDGARVLQLSTAGDGAVAELLAAEVGLMRDLGVDAEWRLIDPDAELFRATKRINHAMRGRPVSLDEHDLRTYLDRNRRCAATLGDEWDVVVVHGPQPAALIGGAAAPSAAWVWRCHIDASAPDPAVWELLRAFVIGYDAFVFTLPEFCPPNLDRERLALIAPAIDPLAAKNRPLPRQLAQQIVAGQGIDLTRPLVLQVSRFDPRQDPLGVVGAWRLARKEVPGLQLTLVGSIIDDDPEGWAIYEQLRAAMADEPDFHLLTNPTGIGALELNAFQREADIVVQQSLRDGFGLTVSEALWKETPVVGSNAGGIPLELGGSGGRLGDDAAGCAAAIVALLENESLANRLAHAGHESVRREFLTPRLLRDDLSLYRKLLTRQQPAASETAAVGAR